MKRITILTTFLVLVGCAQHNEELDNLQVLQKNPKEFYASMPECDTRTHVEDNKYLRWNAGDEITVFNGNSYNSHWQFAGEDGANSGKFTEFEDSGFVTGNTLELTANYAIYPYNENITITEDGVVSLTLPATQVYNHTYTNSFGAGANTMMAVTENTSDNFLAFKNLCGYLKLKFYGEDVTVKSVTIKGNNSEKIAGSATVTMAYGGEPTIVMGDDATNTITIDCGEGVALSSDSENPTIFWAVIPEVTFEGGITITVTDTNGQTFTKSTTNAVPITNNMIQPMAALEVEFALVGPANNEIWYTNGSTTVPTEPLRTNAFGATYLSNVYNIEKECWIMTFDCDVTQIGTEAFRSCWNLTSIYLPKSIKAIGGSAFYACSYLKSVIIQEGVISIEGRAFENCRSIERITIPDSVTSIGTNAFSGCESLSDITLGNSIETIWSSAFVPCNKLKSIVIPESVQIVGHVMFSYGLEEITFRSTVPPGFVWEGAYPFGDSLPLVIYVPKESLNDYKTADVWNKYAELMQPIVSE